MLSELRDLSRAALRFGALLLALAFAIAAFGVRSYEAGVLLVPLPVPSEDSIAASVLVAMREHLLPPGVSLVATAPFSAFSSIMTVSFLLAFLLLLPWACLRLFLWLSPALRRLERRAVAAIFSLGSLLFFIGAFLAYWFALPPLFEFLYGFAAPAGVLPLFSLSDFLAAVFGLSALGGLLFLTPVAVALPTALGLVPASFFVGHWREAAVVALTLSALAAPDPSGIGMIALTVPLLGLYGAGVAAGALLERRALGAITS